MSRARKTREALEKLAALYKYGALQAETDPADFLGMVCEELAALRAIQTATDDERRYCWSGVRQNYAVLYACQPGECLPPAVSFDDTPEGIKRALEAHTAFTEKWGKQS